MKKLGIENLLAIDLDDSLYGSILTSEDKNKEKALILTYKNPIYEEEMDKIWHYLGQGEIYKDVRVSGGLLTENSSMVVIDGKINANINK